VKKIIIFGLIVVAATATLACAPASFAQPYGKGPYNTTVPYGDLTSLSIATSGSINIPITPTSEGVQATGTGTVTVTSTDVNGYKLYIRALNSTNMDNNGALLPTSANLTPASLAVNTWGYNTDASNNFVGITTSDTLIRSIAAPTSTGSMTTITYGMKLDLTKTAGNYTTMVVYTAVPQTD